jgi:MSHA biogenesis protein MshG
MPNFSYVARAAAGNRVEGVIDVADSNAVAEALAGQGLLLLRAERVSAANAAAESGLQRWLQKPPSATELILFCRQLSTLLKAGVPLLRALEGLAESATHRGFAEVLRTMQSALASGRQLSAAMQQHPSVFTPYMINSVRVGEVTGRLTEAFSGLYRQLSFDKENREAVAAALRYPAIVLLVAGAALGAVNIFVIPAFAKAYASFKAQLPLLTRVLIGLSEFFVSYWPLMLGILAGAIVGLKFALGTRAGRRAFDAALLRLPIIGPLLHKAALARFTKSFAIAMEAGVPIIEALDAAVATTGNLVIAERIGTLRAGMERGEALSRAARATGAFTPIVLQMIAVGEETGALGDMMDEVADHYGREVEYAIKSLGSQLEPILIIFLGGFVLVFALGIFLPMWDLSKVAIR